MTLLLIITVLFLIFLLIRFGVIWALFELLITILNAFTGGSSNGGNSGGGFGGGDSDGGGSDDEY